MQPKRIAFFFFTAIFLLVTGNSIAQKVTTVKDTTVFINSDTTVSEVSCNEDFFGSGEKVSNPSKTFLITKSKKTVLLSSFMKTLAMSPEHALVDLDNDGKKELVISDFTGGAHCCDEYFIFRNIAPNKYQFVFQTFGGNVCVDEKNQFVFDFYEQFGYFFTCYACAYSDTSDAAPVPISFVRIKYSKGKPLIVPPEKELRNRIKDNLAKLGEQPYEKLENDIAQDNGLRKAFALNLVVFYYSFGRNIVETKKLFDQYYKYPDAKPVWTEFVRTLNWIKKENNF